MGETLGAFVKRVRLERALIMMAHAPRSSLTTTALKCGFGPPARSTSRGGARRTAPSCRRWFPYHVAVEAERFVPRGEIGRFRFPPMTVAQVELRALQWLYGTWLPRSGYVPGDQPGFEAWIGRPFAHGTEYFELYAQLPIERA